MHDVHELIAQPNYQSLILVLFVGVGSGAWIAGRCQVCSRSKPQTQNSWAPATTTTVPILGTCCLNPKSQLPFYFQSRSLNLNSKSFFSALRRARRQSPRRATSACALRGRFRFRPWLGVSQGLGFRVWGLGFRGLGFRAPQT